MLKHIGDPSGQQREQSSSEQSAVKVIKNELGGGWRSGPVAPEERIDPLAWCLSQMRGGRGLIQVDKEGAPHVYQAMRGGWHYKVAKTGIVSPTPAKNIHSHPGDAAGYGAAVLFPRAGIHKKRSRVTPRAASYWKGLGFERPGTRLPQPGEPLEG